jgi:hypothetical protein
MADASYTGISSGVGASGMGGDPSEDGRAGDDSMACSIDVSRIGYEGAWQHSKAYDLKLFGHFHVGCQ